MLFYLGVTNYTIKMANQLNNIRTVRVEAQELIAQIKLMKWFKETLIFPSVLFDLSIGAMVGDLCLLVATLIA